MNLADPPRRASMYSLQRNPTSEDLPTLSISEASPARVPISQTLPTKGPTSFDMLFSRSSSSSRSRYAFTPPLQPSDTENSMNPKSLFEIRAFANALQRLHGKADDDTAFKDDQERKRRTLKSARMRPATSASSSDSGPFRSTTRFPLTPYPDRSGSLWGLWDNHDTGNEPTGLNISGLSSPLSSSSSAWIGSANTSSTSVGKASDGHTETLLAAPTAKWHSNTAVKSPQMVNVKSSAGRSMCGDVLAITPNYEAMLNLALSGRERTAEEDDFARDIHKRLKEIMGIDPVI